MSKHQLKWLEFLSNVMYPELLGLILSFWIWQRDWTITLSSPRLLWTSTKPKSNKMRKRFPNLALAELSYGVLAKNLTSFKRSPSNDTVVISCRPGPRYTSVPNHWVPTSCIDGLNVQGLVCRCGRPEFVVVGPNKTEHVLVRGHLKGMTRPYYPVVVTMSRYSVVVLKVSIGARASKCTNCGHFQPYQNPVAHNRFRS